MTITETSFCKIQKINSNGIGESSTPQGNVLLPYVLEGEKVEFELCRNVVLLQRRGETLREMRYLCRTQRGSSGCRD